MSNFKEKKTRFSLNIEQKYAIIKYRDEHPNKKQKDLIGHFNLMTKASCELLNQRIVVIK